VIKDYSKKARFSLAALNIFLISATLFLFYEQDIKNGIAYSGMFMIVFVFLIIRGVKISYKKKIIYSAIVLLSVSLLGLGHVKKSLLEYFICRCQDCYST
jgi:hypothetical protein